MSAVKLIGIKAGGVSVATWGRLLRDAWARVAVAYDLFEGSSSSREQGRTFVDDAWMSLRSELEVFLGLLRFWADVRRADVRQV